MRMWQKMVAIPVILWAHNAVAANPLETLLNGADLSTYQVVSVADLKTGLVALDGQYVSVHGTLRAENGIVVLQEARFDKGGVVTDVDHLDSDTKRAMRFRCVPYCTVQLYARIGQSTLGESLIAVSAKVN